jgi:hypothetical protein
MRQSNAFPRPRLRKTDLLVLGRLQEPSLGLAEQSPEDAEFPDIDGLAEHRLLLVGRGRVVVLLGRLDTGYEDGGVVASARPALPVLPSARPPRRLRLW